MALRAMTTADAVAYVSDLDPAKSYKEVPVDPDAPEGLKKRIEVIDDTKSPTVFKLRPLDVFLQGYIWDNSSSIKGKSGESDVEMVTRVNQTNIDTVRFGLAGFDNLKDEKGNGLTFKTQKDVVNGRPYEVASDETMRLFGVKLVGELSRKIQSLSEVSAEDEKN